MEEPLFTHFLVIRLDRVQQSGRNELEPRIRLCIPAPGHSVDTVPAAVTRLAFPDLNNFRHNNRMVSEAFKEELGSNCFMYFRRHLHSQSKRQGANEKEEKSLECLCLITNHGLHEIFEFVMQQVQIRWLLSPNSVPPFFLSLLKQVTEIPPPSGHIALALRPGPDEKGNNENFLFHRPHFDHMGVPSDVLFDYLSIDNVMALMSALLLEQRIIVTSSSITTISQCIYAARSLLYPFKWQHMFASVLPGSMLYHIFATAPFLVGVVDNDMQIVSKLSLHPPMLIVNLDNNTVEATGQIECVALPGMASKLRSKLGHVTPQGVLGDRLKKGLNNILGKSLDMDQVLCSDAIYALWMTFYILSFGDWRKFIDVNASGIASFNTIRFLDAARSSSEEEFIFFERFCHTRTYLVFTEELIRHYHSTLSGLPNDFCRLCSTVVKKDSFDQSLRFYNVLDALKTEMYPSRTGRIAVTALELTSSAPATFDKSSALSMLSQATFSSLGLREIFSVVKYRLGDCEGRSWRHASLTFEMLQALLNNGSDAVLTVLRDNVSQYMQYSQYIHKEEDTQNFIRNQAETLFRTIFDLSDQAKKRARMYYTISDSVLSFKVRVSSPSVSTSENTNDSKCAVSAEIESLSDLKTYVKEFHSQARRDLIEKVNSPWARYREKSIVKGRSRILPKFAKLHKKLAPSEAGRLVSKSSQFEDLLDLHSDSNTLDLSSLNSTIPTVQAPISQSIDLSWFSTGPSSQTSSNGDFMQGLLSGPPTMSKSSADSQSNNIGSKQAPFDPFEGLFK